jgi:EmrB/QacA subfamily drug resistance transporter
MAESRAENGTAQLTPRQIITAMSGLVLAMLMAQLDNMIVAPALPTIVGELGGLNHLSWVVTAYILASTVATPIWGKLGDIFGHKHTFMASIGVFLAGSVLCGASQNMTELVMFRGVQGLGAGGLIVGVMSVIGMLVSPRDRGKYMGVMMAVMPAALIGGPLIGGWITDNASWRWVFYVNLPIGVVSLVVVWWTLHLSDEARHEGKVRIDWWGAGILSVWICSLVLAITWGGHQYPWDSWQIVGLFAVAAVGLVAFLLIEGRTAEPIIPLRLFGIANFSLATALGFIAAFAMFGGITFLPQFQQFVQGASATNSGLLLMPMMIAAMAVSLAGGQVISRTGHYRAFPIVGTVLLTVGLWLFSTMEVTTPTWQTGVYMVVLGTGMGCLMQTTALIAQNSVTIRDLGAATGASMFVRNLGGSLGVAILGAIFASQVTSTMNDAGVTGVDVESTGGLTPAVLQTLPAAAQEVVKQAITDGTQAIFLFAAIITVGGFVVSWFIKQVPLRGPGSMPTPSAEQAAEEVESQIM